MLNAYVGCLLLKEELLKTRMASGCTGEARLQSCLALCFCLSQQKLWWVQSGSVYICLWESCPQEEPWRKNLQGRDSGRHVGVWQRGGNRVLRAPSPGLQHGESSHNPTLVPQHVVPPSRGSSDLRGWGTSQSLQVAVRDRAEKTAMLFSIIISSGAQDMHAHSSGTPEIHL